MHCQCLFVKPVCFPLSAPFILPDLPSVVTCWVCKVDVMGRGAGGVPRQKGPFQPPPCSAAFPGCSPGSVQRCSGLVGWRSGASSSRDPSRALGFIMRPFSSPVPPSAAHLKAPASCSGSTLFKWNQAVPLGTGPQRGWWVLISRVPCSPSVEPPLSQQPVHLVLHKQDALQLFKMNFSGVQLILEAEHENEP